MIVTLFTVKVYKSSHIIEQVKTEKQENERQFLCDEFLTSHKYSSTNQRQTQTDNYES